MDVKSIGGLSNQLNVLFSMDFSNENKADFRLDPVATELAAAISNDTIQDLPKQEGTVLHPSIFEIKQGTLYCGTCPYNSGAVDEMKRHTFLQHPKGAAVITNNSNQNVSNLPNPIFFCIKETCSLYTTKFNTYEEHLMNCCSLEQEFSEEEKERLKASLQLVFDLEKQHYLTTFSRFLNFFSAFREMHASSSDIFVTNYNSAEENLNSHESIDHNLESENFSWETTSSSCNNLSSSNIDLSCNANDEVCCVVENPVGRQNDSSSDTIVKHRSDATLKSDSFHDGFIVPCHEPEGCSITQQPKSFGSNMNTQEDFEIYCEDDLSNELDNDISTREDKQRSRTTGAATTNITVTLDENNDYIPCEQTFSSLQRPECDLAGDGSGQHGNESNEDKNPEADMNRQEGGTECVNNISPHINHCQDSGQHLVTETDPKKLTTNSQKPTENQTLNNCIKRGKDLNCFIGFKTDIHKYSSECKECTVSLKRIDTEILDNYGNIIFSPQYDTERHKDQESKRFKCHHCETYFVDGHSLGRHLETHMGEKPFECLECGKNFYGKKIVSTHMRTHTGEKPFECLKCGKNFYGKKIFNTHMRTHTGEKPFKCLECGKNFRSNDYLKVHLRIHTGEKPFKCLDCGRNFTHRSNFIEHKRRHTGEKPFKCLECGKNFATSHQVTVHKRMHTGERPFKCLECGKNYAYSGQLTTHKRSHTGEKPFKCLECGKNFRNNKYLKVHLRIHTGEKPFKCCECNHTFAKRCLLNVHMRIHTGNEIKCKECGNVFVSKANLIRHMRLHSGERSYVCEICGKTFRDPSNLRSHATFHTDKKPFKCDQCGKKFKQNHGLLAHMRRHEGQRQFLCTECGKRFHQNCKLQWHMRIHTGEKSFICKECGKKFRIKTYLDLHMRTHTGDKPHVCSVCCKGFTNRSNLVTHMRAHKRAITTKEVD